MQGLSDLESQEKSVGKEVEALGEHLAKSVESNRNSFSSKLNGAAKALSDRRNSLRASLARSPEKTASNAKDAEQRALAALEKLRTLLKTTTHPVITDLDA